MNSGIVKILDINGLSYLYGKLKANIDAFQATSRTDITAAIADATAATTAANDAAAKATEAATNATTTANNAAANVDNKVNTAVDKAVPTAVSNAMATGNAATASKLATARTITINGAVSGSTTFDGSGNVTITTSVSAGTAAPGSLANGAIFCVYE